MRPTLKGSGKYVLQCSNGYVQACEPTLVTTKDQTAARVYRGDYLNTTRWDWWLTCKAMIVPGRAVPATTKPN